MIEKKLVNFIFLISSLLLISGCDFKTHHLWEMMGWEKREILASEVEKVEENQREIKKDFEEIRVRVLKEYNGSENIGTLYQRLNKDYKSVSRQAKELKERAQSIRAIARELFAEWEKESSEITNSSFRKDSRYKLKLTRSKFNKLNQGLKRAERQLEVVLTQLKDQTLYLKHNLNARFVIIFENEVKVVRRDITKLIQSIEKTILQSQHFQNSLT